MRTEAAELEDLRTQKSIWQGCYTRQVVRQLNTFHLATSAVVALIAMRDQLPTLTEATTHELYHRLDVAIEQLSSALKVAEGEL